MARSTERGPSEVLSDDAIRKLMQSCGTSTSGIRMKATIALAFGAALRSQELCDLMPADVDLETGAITVRGGKGGKSAKTSCTPGMLPHVLAWAERRKAIGANGRHRFLCTHSKNNPLKPLSTGYLRNALARLVTKAGLEDRRVHWHAFRATAATRLLRRTGDLEAVRDFLRHSNIATTAAYIARVDPERLRSMVRDDDFGSDF